MKNPVYLFDMNGVIVDDEHLHERATKHILQQYGHICTTEDYKRYFAGRTRDAGMKQFGAANNATYDYLRLAEEKDEAYQLFAKEGVSPVAHVIEFIKYLGEQGVRMAVVTGAPRREAKHFLELFDIADHFSQIVTGEDITLSKPHPEGYLKAAAMLQVPPERCVVVEDAPNGVKAAKRAGMRCIAVTTSHEPYDLHEADWVVEHLHDDFMTMLRPRMVQLQLQS
jgi:HAD superfamily hydrolase (TIGR01509 family)